MFTLASMTCLLFVHSGSGWAAEPATGATGPAPIQSILPPTSSAGSGTDIPVLSTTGAGKNKITHKKEGLLVVSPLRTQMRDEDYSKLGPGGTPTPACPIDASGCPDINGKINGVTPNSAILAAQCPAVCVKTRGGDLSGSVPAVCPSGYVQVGMFNAQAEWIMNPNASDNFTIPAPTNDRATFLKYWNDPDNYHCYNEQAYATMYGNPGICVAYGGPEYLVGYYDIWYGDQPWKIGSAGEFVVASWSMGGNAYQPGWYQNPLDGYSYSEQVKYNIQGVFDAILASNRIPATWRRLNNHNSALSVNSALYESSPVAGWKSEACFDYGYGSYCTEKNVPPHDEIITYKDSQCKIPALTNATCNWKGPNLGYYGRNADPAEPEHHLQMSYKKGDCPQLYIKARIPVFSMLCYQKGKALKPSGKSIPVSVICSRVQPVWK